MKRNFILPTLLALMAACLFSACSSGGDTSVAARLRPADMNAATPRKITRLDREIRDYINMDSAARNDMVEREAIRLRAFGFVVGDSVEPRSLALWSTWPATVMFMPEVEKIYSDLDAEEKALGLIYAVAAKNDVSLPANDFVAVVWGNPRSIGFVDSTMFIALNHYLGPLNPAYEGWPEYERRFKTRDMIPVDMAEALVATAAPYNPKGDPTVLSRLLYEGALAVAKEAMVPAASRAAILGFTDAELADIKANQAIIWKRLVADNRLYSTDAELRKDLFALKARTLTISPDAPGRAVRFVGYRIVTEWLRKNPEATLRDILDPGFYSDGAEVLRVADVSFVDGSDE